MTDALSFIEDAQLIDQPHNQQQYLHKTLLKILPQIWECALFVKEYIADERLKHQTFSECAKIITDMKTNLVSLRNSLDSGSVIHAAITSSMILENVQSLCVYDCLLILILVLSQHLKPAEMEVSHRGVCLSDTREEIITSILDGLLNVEPGTDQRVLWLHGPAGCGKSTLATTIANHFIKDHRRGAFVFFDRSRAEASRPRNVIRTIAYQLGLHDPFIQSALVKCVKEAGDIDILGLADQFSKLWVDPLCNAQQMHARPGPIIIIIDALDVCGTSRERQSLLQLLSEEVTRLPSNYHFFITSRPEPDIMDHLSQKQHIKEMSLDISSESNQQDVHTFLKKSMAGIQQRHKYLPSTWPNSSAIDKLLQMAGGLFIWASTAVSFIAESHDPGEQLSNVLNSELKGGAEANLDSLYETVLHDTKIWDQPVSVSQSWLKVLGLLVIAKAPITYAEIDKMLGLENAHSSYRFFEQLRSLLHWSPDYFVQLLHASIADYLTDKERCGDKPWFIDIAEQSDSMTRTCLHAMQAELHFNICNLETSHVSNRDVVDLENRIKHCISPQLSYSCQFWTDHLSNTAYTPEMCDLVIDFCSKHTLFWIEAMSLLNCPLSPGIRAMLQWSQNDQLNTWIEDIHAFVTMFHAAFMESTPHLYVTCLPWSPAQSKMAEAFATTFSTLTIQT
ncbi:hypothetical protein B0H21DRAFT_851412, partial [Amylocystis lapponica]